MPASDRFFSATSRRKALAATLAGALGLAAAGASATCSSLVATSCADSGAGTLRDIVACADSGDTVDLTQLACSTISLASRVSIPQEDLTLNGPGAEQLTIDGGYHDRVFLHHIGGNAGTLHVSGMTITRGYYAANEAHGGCIVSGAGVTLVNTTVELCKATSLNTQAAVGGGIYTYGDLTLVRSTITRNVAVAAQPGASAFGGGVAVNYNFTAKYSTIASNAAEGAAGSRGGGVFAPRREITIADSAITGNGATIGAGVDAQIASTRAMLISNSTVSGNLGVNWPALYTQHATTIRNSTIAFNRASANAAAVEAFNASLGLESTIIADNLGAGVEFDLSGSSVVVSGADNLIRSTALTVPNSITGSCPHLGPLTANGGPTLTHPLLGGSPAVEAGNNNASLGTDQRGAGFIRTVGSAPDIGAYERATGAIDDRIFKSGIEVGCDE